MAPEDAAAAAAAAAIRELNEGLEFAGGLGSRLPPADPEAAKLFEGLTGALSRALSALQPGESGQGKVSSPSGDRKREVSGGKRKAGPAPAKDRRGGCRRRSQPSSWTRITSTKMEDGFSWRKYGQKEIHSAKFPRSYFRCTHKHDQGCQATRQVQKSEEDPSLLIITYMGEHTCRDPTKVPLTLAQPVDPRLISFSSTLTREPHKLLDYDEDVLSNPTPGTSSSDYNLVPLPDLPAVGRLADHGDVTSGFHSSRPSFDDDDDMDMGLLPAFEFADFSFGFGEDDDDQQLVMGRDPHGPPT